MKKLPTLIFLAFWLGTTSLLAQDPSAPDGETSSEVAPSEEASGPSEEEIHDELRALKKTMETALNERDIDTLVANVDEDVVFTTMNGDVVRGPEKIREYFERMMVGDDRIVDSITTTFEPEALSILHDDDVAIAYGHSQDHYELTRGGVFDVTARWSTTMWRRDGRWVVASFHYSTNMFDNPILEGQRRFLLGAGMVLALVLGGLGFWLGRRKSA